MTHHELEDLAYRHLTAALEEIASGHLHDTREAEDRAAKWAAVLTSLHVHAEHVHVREARQGVEVKQTIGDALREAIANRKKLATDGSSNDGPR